MLPICSNHVTLCPLSFINAVVPLSAAHSNCTILGMSWSWNRAAARASARVMFRSSTLRRARMVAVGILEPPAAPTMKYGCPSGVSTITGEMEERGRLRGRM
jgi:hypothetical protein